MYYIMTQLKDLPDTPAGTVFRCKDDKIDRWHKPGAYWVLTPDGQNYEFKKRTLFDNPDWFKKEIDYDKVAELKCPKCGSTQGSFFSTEWYVRDMDRDNYGTQFSVGFECVCGHRRVLYGTASGNRRLSKMIGED